METFREFCADSLRQKKLAGEFKERSDPLRLTLKRTKRNIENFFIQNDVETAKVVLKDHDPPITYLTRNNKVQCRRITRETVEEGLEHCFEDLTDEQISDTEVLGKCIWESIHRARQVDRLVLRISNKPEDKRRMLAGGEDAPYTLDLSAKIGVLVKNYWAATEDLKRLRKTKKEKESVLSERIKQRCPLIMKHMGDRQKTSQRINMKHNNTPCAFYVRVKTSSTRPAIKKEDMCKVISDTLTQSKTLSDIRNAIINGFENLPRKITQRVSLDRGHYQSVSTDPASAPASNASVSRSVFDEEEEDNVSAVSSSMVTE